MHAFTTSITRASFVATALFSIAFVSVAYADVAPLPPPQDPFTDVSYDDGLVPSVEYLKKNSAINGYPDGTFRPDNLINRAEFAKIVLLMHTTMKVATPIEGAPMPPFSDIENGAWYEPYIRAAYENAVLSGYPDGTFRPNDTINFAEAAKIVVRAYGLEYEESVTGAWYQPYWDALQSRELIPSSVLSPDQNITRGEMAQLLYYIAYYNSTYRRSYFIR